MSERLTLAMSYIHSRLLDLKREDGQGVTEYGIVLAFVAVALGAVLVTLGGSISAFIGRVGGDIANLA